MKKIIFILFTVLLLNGAVPVWAQDCNPATNLTVSYTEDCKAELTWDAPSKTRTEMLWDNTAGMTGTGFISSRWLLEMFSRTIMADDFYIPPGITWTIEEITFYGFHITTTGEYNPPDNIGIEIYTDNGNNLPGTRIYENISLLTNGGTFQGIQTVTLPEPLEISEGGRYWIAIYGTYFDLHTALNRYNIVYSSVPKGANLCYWDEEDGPDAWVPMGSNYPSMYFSISGYKEGTSANFYNIYRDGVRIATIMEETSYTDNAFVPTSEHTWSVRVICETGDDSAPVYQNLKSCIELEECNPITNGAVTFTNNTAVITWDAVPEAKSYKVSRDGKTETVTLPTYSEIDEFENEKEYTWTIVTVCEGNESEPVEVKGVYLGIHGTGISAFSIFPNPAQNEITISARTDFHTVEVINFLGQIAISQSVSGNSVQLNIKDLTNGIYFVRTISQNGIHVQKFVKQ